MSHTLIITTNTLKTALSDAELNAFALIDVLRPHQMLFQRVVTAACMVPPKHFTLNDFHAICMKIQQTYESYQDEFFQTRGAFFVCKTPQAAKLLESCGFTRHTIAFPMYHSWAAPA